MSRLGQAGMATRSAMLRRILKPFPGLPGKNTQSTMPASGTGQRADNQPSKSEMQDIKWLLSKTVFPNYVHDSFCIAIEKWGFSTACPQIVCQPSLGILTLNLMFPRQIWWILFHNGKTESENEPFSPNHTANPEQILKFRDNLFTNIFTCFTTFIVHLLCAKY